MYLSVCVISLLCFGYQTSLPYAVGTRPLYLMLWVPDLFTLCYGYQTSLPYAVGTRPVYLMLWVPDLFTQGQEDQRMKLNTYLHLEVRMRIYGTLLPPLCVPVVYDIYVL